MNKRQAKIEALDIAAAVTWKEAHSESDLTSHISEKDWPKVKKALDELALDLQERCGKLVQRNAASAAGRGNGGGDA